MAAESHHGSRHEPPRTRRVPAVPIPTNRHAACTSGSDATKKISGRQPHSGAHSTPCPVGADHPAVRRVHDQKRFRPASWRTGRYLPITHRDVTRIESGHSKSDEVAESFRHSPYY